MMAAARTAKPDAVGVGAIDAARTALTDLVDAGDVGEHLGHASEGERVITHFFACTRAGYRGWRWSVTLVRASRQKTVTVDEVVLLPGDDAIVAPAWVPWRERIQPGDLGPGDLLPTEEDDPRLVPAYLAGEDDLPDDEEGDTIAAVTDELGLGRPRVLSLEGRELAAQRWYDGSHGPEAAIAQSAPGTLRAAAASWSAWPGRSRPCSACAPTPTPTTTAGSCPSTTAAARTARRSCTSGTFRRRFPSRCSTPSPGTTSSSSDPARSWSPAQFWSTGGPGTARPASLALRRRRQ